MSWEALGAIGEVAGAIATLIMLVYLSIQVRHARNATQSSNELEASKLFTQYANKWADNPELQRLWDKVAKDSENLTDEETTNFLWAIDAFCHAAEGVWDQYVKGLVSERVWLKWERAIIGQLRIPICNIWWANRTAPYSSEFYEYIDRALEKQSTWQMPAANDVVNALHKSDIERASDT